jgi:hypothetical protein
MKKIAGTFLVISAFSISLCAQTSLIAEKYLKIKPAVSTREDVEKLLGKNNSKEYTVLYFIGDETIQIEYSDENCSPKPEGSMFPEWRVKAAFYVQREKNCHFGML